MKKNITVNIFGTLYPIDEDAYELLQKYNDNMRRYYSQREGGDEIADDDGLTVVDKGRMIYDGGDHGDITVEGPKIYKREGKYWILCPAGSVKPGYQLALRSESIYGPYERRVVLRQ